MHRSFSGVPRSFLVAPTTAALVACNLVLFLAMAAASRSLWSISGEALIVWGSNFGLLTLGPQPWRLVTGLFVHGGLLHVALNMVALVQGGAIVERLFGRARYLALYFGAGITASVASVAWRPDINSVGASGAIFGIFAALLVAVRQRRDLIPREVFRRVRSGLLAFLAFSLFAGFVVPGVDNAAHLGGLLGGLVLGYALAPRIAGTRGPRPFGRLMALGGLAAALLVIWPSAHPPAPAANHAIPGQPPIRPMDPDFLDTLIVTTLEEDRELILGYNLIIDGVRRQRLSGTEAARSIEQELLPRWETLILNLTQYEPYAPPGDDRLALLRHYAGLRREALRAMTMAVHGHSGIWLAAANQAQGQADRVMEEFQLRQIQAHRLDRGPAPR